MNLSLLAFCFRSLYREYGAEFLTRVIFAHPVAAARGIGRYTRGWTSTPAHWPGGAGSLVGIGFCLKPLTPACPTVINSPSNGATAVTVARLFTPRFNSM